VQVVEEFEHEMVSSPVAELPSLAKVTSVVVWQVIPLAVEVQPVSRAVQPFWVMV
jgi:hypothetical protein